MFEKINKEFTLGIRQFEESVGSALDLGINAMEYEMLNVRDDDIVTAYFIEKSSDKITTAIKNGYTALLKAMHTFFVKIKKAVQKKINKAKMKIQLNKVKKIMAEENSGNSKNLSNDHLYNNTAEYVDDYVKYTTSYVKIIINTTSHEDDVDKATEKINDEKKKLDEKYDKLKKCGPQNIFAIKLNDAVQMSEKDIDEMDKLVILVEKVSTDCIQDLERQSEKLSDSTGVVEESLKANSDKVADEARKKVSKERLVGLCKSAATNISAFVKKVVNVLIRHSAFITSLCINLFGDWRLRNAYKDLKKDEEKYVSKETIKKKLSEENIA